MLWKRTDSQTIKSNHYKPLRSKSKIRLLYFSTLHLWWEQYTKVVIFSTTLAFRDDVFGLVACSYSSWRPLPPTYVHLLFLFFCLRWSLGNTRKPSGPRLRLKLNSETTTKHIKLKLFIFKLPFRRNWRIFIRLHLLNDMSFSIFWMTR